MTLPTSTRLGPYEITDQIGAGGMGQVYRARDTRLNRDVALKVLPDIFVRDADRLARFRREAQVLASLNHPNIAVIHGLEESDGVQALVLELVEGPTLADRIAQGAISLDEALPVARQIAAALEAAHEQGVIHRDLKPANIKVRPDNTVKVLDFGLAKALESPARAAGGSGEAGRYIPDSPTITSPALMTGIGVLLGTAAYMSPEQAKGRPADKRSDIWAFGCVLYEMLTGQRAFDGEDVTETLASVVKERVDLSRVPRPVRRLIAKCLERDPKNRLRDIGDAWTLLEEDAHPSASDRTMKLTMLASVTAAIVATTALAALAWVHFREDSPPGRTLHYTIESVPGAVSARGTSFAMSPDGRFIVMAALSNGRQQLWLRPLDGLDWRPLAGTDAAINPFWSSDGRFIAFFDGQQLKKIAVDGGPPVAICDATGPANGTWNADDVIVFSSAIGGGSALQRVPAAGGRPAAIPNITGRSPVFLSGGARLLYINRPSSRDGGIFLASLDGKESRLVVPSAFVSGFVLGGPNEGDQLVYVRDETLMTQRFDVRTGAMSGDPVPLAPSVAQLYGFNAVTVSPSGVIAYWSNGSRNNQLTWYDRSGRMLEPVGAPGTVWEPAISPDGRTVAYARSVGQRSDIWLWDVARKVERRLTVDPSRNDTPVWSPAGDRIVFRSARAGQQDLWVRAANGSGQDEPVPTSGNPKFPSQWATDDTIVYSENAGATDIDLWSIGISRSAKPTKFLQTRFEESQGQVSPDGRWIAYTSNQTGRPEIYVAPRVQAEAATRVSSAGGEQPRWRGDGRELFFVAADGKMMSAIVPPLPQGQTTFEHRSPVALFDTHIAPAVFTRAVQYDVTRDGTRFVVTTDLAPTRSGVPPFDIVVNWRSPSRK